MRGTRTVRTGRADRFGSKVFIDLRPGAGYRVVQRRGARVVATRRLRVLRGERPPGGRLLPRPAPRGGPELRPHARRRRARDDRPPARRARRWPTGRSRRSSSTPATRSAAPHDLLASVVASLTGGPAPNDPLAPATVTAVGSLIAPLLGFAVVSVQMRGSGCSGGAFDLFGLPTTYDGYDAVETVAAQTWVKGGKVGLAGISFSGITQLFVAGTRPPHLAAIAPMSVTDDLYTATGFPGGIFNSGFAASWIAGAHGATPARRPAGGQPYAQVARRGRATRTASANQRLRLQTQDLTRSSSEQNPYRDAVALRPALARRVARARSASRRSSSASSRTSRPAGTSRRASARLKGNPQRLDLAAERRPRRLARADDDHALGRVPQALRRRRDPGRSRTPCSALSGALYTLPGRRGRRAGAAVALRGHDRRRGRQARPSSATRACALLMDNGAGPQGPGSIGATWELGFERLAAARRLQRDARAASAPGGALAPTRAAQATTAAYVADPERAPAPDAAGRRRRRTPGRRSRPTTGRRSPPARASASRPRRWRRTS